MPLASGCYLIWSGQSSPLPQHFGLIEGYGGKELSEVLVGCQAASSLVTDRVKVARATPLYPGQPHLEARESGTYMRAPQTPNSDYQLEPLYPKHLPSLNKYMHNTQVKMPKDSASPLQMRAHTQNVRQSPSVSTQPLPSCLHPTPPTASPYPHPGRKREKTERPLPSKRALEIDIV